MCFGSWVSVIGLCLVVGLGSIFGFADVYRFGVEWVGCYLCLLLCLEFWV